MALTLGEAFGEGFGWKHDVSESCEIARTPVETQHAELWRMTSLRRCSVLRDLRVSSQSDRDWRLEGCVFGVLDVAATLGSALRAVASKLCFRDKSQLTDEHDFGGCECAQHVSKSFQTCGVVQIWLN